MERWLKAASVLVLQSLEGCGAGAGSRGDDAPGGYRTAASGLGHLELGFRRGLRAGLPAPPTPPYAECKAGGDSSQRDPQGMKRGLPRKAGDWGPPDCWELGSCWLAWAVLVHPGVGAAWRGQGPGGGLPGSCGVGVELGGFMGQGVEKSPLHAPR